MRENQRGIVFVPILIVVALLVITGVYIFKANYLGSRSINFQESEDTSSKNSFGAVSQGNYDSRSSTTSESTSLPNTSFDFESSHYGISFSYKSSEEFVVSKDLIEKNIIDGTLFTKRVDGWEVSTTLKAAKIEEPDREANYFELPNGYEIWIATVCDSHKKSYKNKNGVTITKGTGGDFRGRFITYSNRACVRNNKYIFMFTLTHSRSDLGILSDEERETYRNPDGLQEVFDDFDQTLDSINLTDL